MLLGVGDQKLFSESNDAYLSPGSCKHIKKKAHGVEDEGKQQ